MLEKDKDGEAQRNDYICIETQNKLVNNYIVRTSVDKTLACIFILAVVAVFNLFWDKFMFCKYKTVFLFF